MELEVVVLGSLNHDTILSLPRFPEVGETLAADAVTQSPGGKGANQAVQLAKLGARTLMAGAVGDDVNGAFLLDCLVEAGVDVAGVSHIDAPTGMALIEAVPDGSVTCCIVHGANYEVSIEDVDALAPAIAEAGWLVLQMEVPRAVDEAAIRLAKSLGARVVLNAAPAMALDEACLAACDVLVLNEVEAAFFWGAPVPDRPTALAAAAELGARYDADVVITLGALGSVAVGAEGAIELESVASEVVETTGAGDSYVGGLVRALIDGASLGEACEFASRCAALTVTRVGAQSAMPTLAELRGPIG